MGVHMNRILFIVTLSLSTSLSISVLNSGYDDSDFLNVHGIIPVDNNVNDQNKLLEYTLSLILMMVIITVANHLILQQ